MNKHLTAFLIALVATGVAVAPALAQDETASPSAQPRSRFFLKREEIKDKLKSLQQRIHEKRESVNDRREEKGDKQQERLSEAQKKRIKDWWTKTSRRLQALLERQQKLATRIEERISRLSAAGQDTTKQKAALTELRAKIASTEQSLKDASAKVDGILNDNSSREAFSKLHELHRGLLVQMKEIHRSLIALLASLRSTSVSPTPTPTRTPVQ